MDFRFLTPRWQMIKFLFNATDSRELLQQPGGTWEARGGGAWGRGISDASREPTKGGEFSHLPLVHSTSVLNENKTISLKQQKG